MTIIFGGPDSWVEVFFLARRSVAANGLDNTDQLLTRSGRLAGAAGVSDNDVIGNNASRVGLVVKNTDDSALTYGQILTTIRLTLANSTGSPQTFGAIAIIFMTK